MAIKWRIVATHNPQDYYSGKEPSELVISMVVNALNCVEIASLTLEGYKVIVEAIKDV